MIEELCCIDARYYVAIIEERFCIKSQLCKTLVCRNHMLQSYKRDSAASRNYARHYVAIIQDVMLKLNKSNAALCRNYALHYFAILEDVMSQICRNYRRRHDVLSQLCRNYRRHYEVLSQLCRNYRRRIMWQLYKTL